MGALTSWPWRNPERFQPLWVVGPPGPTFQDMPEADLFYLSGPHSQHRLLLHHHHCQGCIHAGKKCLPGTVCLLLPLWQGSDIRCSWSSWFRALLSEMSCLATVVASYYSFRSSHCTTRGCRGCHLSSRGGMAYYWGLAPVRGFWCSQRGWFPHLGIPGTGLLFKTLDTLNLEFIPGL